MKHSVGNMLRLVVAYLEGTGLDIYKAEETKYWVPEFWDMVWHEAKFMGFEPDTAQGMRGYAKEVGVDLNAPIQYRD